MMKKIIFNERQYNRKRMSPIIVFVLAVPFMFMHSSCASANASTTVPVSTSTSTLASTPAIVPVNTVNTPVSTPTSTPAVEKKESKNSSLAQSFEDITNPKRIDGFSYGTGRTTAHDDLIKIEDDILKIAIDENDKAGAWNGRNYSFNELSHFGTYSARIKIPSATKQSNVGAVVGFYTYYNDEWSSTQPKDINDNGIYDNSEIDFEWLIADPEIIYLTAWTDYQEFPNGTTKFGKVGRVINMATGTIISTDYAETWGKNKKLTGIENKPETIKAIPGFNASKEFYTYGFDWMPDGIRWWIINPNDPDEQIVLWDYKGPAKRITQKPAHLSFNIWHTNNWPVVTKRNSTEKPKQTFWAELDWIKFEPAAGLGK